MTGRQEVETFLNLSPTNCRAVLESDCVGLCMLCAEPLEEAVVSPVVRGFNQAALWDILDALCGHILKYCSLILWQKSDSGLA